MTHDSTSSGGQEPSGVARFGYRESFERTTGRFASFAVAFAFVSIATGIFTTYGSVLNSSGPLGIWTWPIVVVGQLAVALLIGALAARIPVTGYAYQWVSRLANPVLGWITGWISFTFLAIVVIAVDYTVAATVLPALFGFQGTPATAFLITATVLVLQAVLVGLSTTWTERVNNFAVTAELVGMVALVALLLIVGVIAHKLDVGNLFSTGEVSPPSSTGASAPRPRPARGCSGSCWAPSPSSASNPPRTLPKRRSGRRWWSPPAPCGRPCWRRACSVSCSCSW